MYDLYEMAEQNKIQICRFPLPLTKSISVPGYVGMDDSLIYDGKDERTRLGHELGHNMRHAFYTRNDPPYIRRRCENMADKWEIKKLVPKDKLKEAIDNGYTEVWDLSDYFGVTEELIKKAFCLYAHGNLELEYYGLI